MLVRSPEEEPKGAFRQSGQSELARPAFRAFLVELKVLFQVVGRSGKMHAFVRLCEADGIYLS
ncbi:hypothetical protein BFP77_11190 [Maribacter sp. 4U21]|nr:hypothetical protein BFP77_11190 [Maribacter sp. 4U21]